MSEHPRRAHIHFSRNTGEKIADGVVAGMGSWRFIIIQTVIVAAWIVGNLYLLSKPFDPFPFILLNLLFSTQAAYASPLILMASNRQASKDKVRDNLEAQEVDELHTMNKQQIIMLEQQGEEIKLLKQLLEAVQQRKR